MEYCSNVTASATASPPSSRFHVPTAAAERLGEGGADQVELTSWSL
jgi:hypothetical protein